MKTCSRENCTRPAQYHLRVRIWAAVMPRGMRSHKNCAMGDYEGLCFCHAHMIEARDSGEFEKSLRDPESRTKLYNAFAAIGKARPDVDTAQFIFTRIQETN